MHPGISISRSVRPSVCWSVGPLVRPSITVNSAKMSLVIILNGTLEMSNESPSSPRPHPLPYPLLHPHSSRTHRCSCRSCFTSYTLLFKSPPWEFVRPPVLLVTKFEFRLEGLRFCPGSTALDGWCSTNTQQLIPRKTFQDDTYGRSQVIKSPTPRCTVYSLLKSTSTTWN